MGALLDARLAGSPVRSRARPEPVCPLVELLRAPRLLQLRVLLHGDSLAMSEWDVQALVGSAASLKAGIPIRPFEGLRLQQLELLHLPQRQLSGESTFPMYHFLEAIKKFKRYY